MISVIIPGIFIRVQFTVPEYPVVDHAFFEPLKAKQDI